MGVFLSALTENAIAAMAATIGVAIFSALLDAVRQSLVWSRINPKDVTS